MRIGLFGGSIGTGSIDDVIAEASAAHEGGFASFWVPQIFGYDALTVLALVARDVPGIELGTSVIPTYPRHPMMLAQQAHTVNLVADGRLCLGIGLSHQIVIEHMMGMSFDKPVRHLREYLSILGPLSRNEAAGFKGETYSTFASLSIPNSRPFGIVVAALGEQMLKVTARMADGTLTWCTGPATLAAHTIPTINQAAEEAERPAPRIIAALPVCVTDDVAGARARAAEIFAIYGQLPSYRAMMDREGVAGPADLAIVGTASEVVDRIGALRDIGVTDFAAAEFPSTPDEAGNTRAAVLQLL